MGSDKCPCCGSAERGKKHQNGFLVCNHSWHDAVVKRVVHIHEAYPWYCNDADEADITSTNVKDVNCPSCLTNKPVDLYDHPLAEFFREMVAEYNASKIKYGSWSDLTDDQQTKAVKSECLEWEAATLKTTGSVPRELGELPQLANVAAKRWIELRKS